MDPNALSNLDPKLKETYERVMGTQTPAASSPPAQPQSEALSQNISSPIQPGLAQEKPEAVTISQPLPTNPAPMTPLTTPQSHSGLLKALYIVGAIVFFAVYVFFWAKIFNVTLPF